MPLVACNKKYKNISCKYAPDQVGKHVSLNYQQLQSCFFLRSNDENTLKIDASPTFHKTVQA